MAGGGIEVTKMQTLELLSEAMKALKRSKKLGVDVKPAKPLMEHALRAFSAGDYAEARRLGEEVLRRFSGST